MATEKVRLQWLQLETWPHAIERGLRDASYRTEETNDELKAGLQASEERVEQASGERGVKLTESFRAIDWLQEHFNEARAERRCLGR